MTDKIVPTNKLPKQELVDQLHQYVDDLIEEIGEGNGAVGFKILIPVAVDAGVFFEVDGDKQELYGFDLVEDHDESWQPKKLDYAEDVMEVLDMALREQIQNANKDQLVRYTRWAFNMITRG